MVVSREEIDAEKRTKPRLDLVPAIVLRRLTANTRVGHLVELITEAYEKRSIADLELALYEIAVIGGQTCAVDLLPFIAEVQAYGFEKHGDCTWRVRGTEQATLWTHYGSALRHAFEYALDPSAVEEGSGIHVLWHCAAQISIMMEIIERGHDRPETPIQQRPARVVRSCPVHVDCDDPTNGLQQQSEIYRGGPYILTLGYYVVKLTPSVLCQITAEVTRTKVDFEVSR